MTTPVRTTSTIFGREPAEVISAIQAALLLLVALGAPYIWEDVVPLIVAVIAALFGVWEGLKVRPIAPSIFTTLVAAVVPLVAGYGFQVDPEVVAAVNAFIVAVLGLQVRAQVSPKEYDLSA